jgi:hypothetical protein
MAVVGTDLLMIERSGTLYKTPVSDLPSGGGGTAGITLIQQEVISTAVSAVDFDLPAEYSRYRLIIQDLTYSSSGSYLFGTISLDGGITFESTDYAYRVDKWFSSTGVTSQSFYPTNGMVLVGNDLDDNPTHSVMDIVNTPNQISVNATTLAVKPTATAYAHRHISAGWRQNASKADVLRLRDFSNTITGGTISLYGYKEAL